MHVEDIFMSFYICETIALAKYQENKKTVYSNRRNFFAFENFSRLLLANNIKMLANKSRITIIHLM